jgi:hypothetical protein
MQESGESVSKIAYQSARKGVKDSYFYIMEFSLWLRKECYLGIWFTQVFVINPLLLH